MSMSRDVCIFFQATAELPYVLQLYEQFKETSRVKIVVVNVLANYNFITSLNLAKADIDFCKWPPLKRNMFFAIPSNRTFLKDFWNSHLAKIAEGDVYFFSASFDWVTAYFLRRFSTKKNIKVHYAGFNTTEVLLKEAYENGTINKGIGKKDILRLCCLFFITGIWFDILKDLPCVSFPYFRYGIKHETIDLNVETISPYKYEIPSDNRNNILFFSTTWDYEGEVMKKHVDARICDILEELKSKGYKVIAKGHPRLGLASSIENAVDIVMPNYIPAEFISTKNIKMIVGINSAAIIYYAKNSNIQVYSLLKMIDGLNEKIVNDSLELFAKMCDGRIIIPKTTEEMIVS